MVQIIDGKALAQKMQAALAKKVSSLKAEKGIVPGLAVILVGDNPASQVYVRNKERAALAAGFKSETVRLSDSVCQEELIELIRSEEHTSEPQSRQYLVCRLLLEKKTK